MSSPSLPPMNWYPDPSNPSQERYWDGTQWTANTREPDQSAAWRAGLGHRPMAAQPQNDSTGAANYHHHQAQQAPTGGYIQQGYQPGPESMQLRNDQVSRNYAKQFTADGVKLAGWWWRVLASLIDLFLVGLVVAFIARPYIDRVYAGFTAYFNDAMALAQSGRPTTSLDINAYDLSTPALMISMYSIGLGLLIRIVMVRFFGAGPGQLITGLRVVPLDNGLAPRGLTWRQSIVRGVAYGALEIINAYTSIILPVNAIIVAASSKKQGLHDMVAKTQVIRDRRHRS